MTQDEKREAIRSHCYDLYDLTDKLPCGICSLRPFIQKGEFCHSHDADIERNYAILFGNYDREEVEVSEADFFQILGKGESS